MATMTANEQELRDALYAAQRALLHASNWLQGSYAKGPETPGAEVQILVNDTLAYVSRTLDIGRDERNEQGGT